MQMNPQKMKPIIQCLIMEELNRQKENMRTQMAMAMMAATLITLYDKYDWQPEQLVKVMKEIFEQFECVAEKYVKIDDFYAELESMGIKVVDEIKGLKK